MSSFSRGWAGRIAAAGRDLTKGPFGDSPGLPEDGEVTIEVDKGRVAFVTANYHRDLEGTLAVSLPLNEDTCAQFIRLQAELDATWDAISAESAQFIRLQAELD